MQAVTGTPKIVSGLGRVLYRVEGLSPLLMHNPAGSMRVQTGGPKAKVIPTPADEAEAGTYRLPDKQLCGPASGLWRGITDATEGRKFGRTFAKRVFGGTLFPAQEWCGLVDPESELPLVKHPIPEDEIYICRAVIEGKGVMRARLRVWPWSTTVEFSYDPGSLRVEWITEIFIRAGEIRGWMDQRPGAPKTPGPYGRYKVALLETNDAEFRTS